MNNIKQKVTISTDGSITSLLTNQGQGVDLFRLGKCSVQRFSVILFNEPLQKFFIKILQGKYKNQYLTDNLLNNNNRKQIVYFSSYEEAKKTELYFYNSVR